MNLDNIPQELKARVQWVCWAYRDKGDGRATKMPLNALTGRPASSTNPDTWSTFAGATAAMRANGYDGVGFVFTEEDGYIGIDLDDCLTDITLRQSEANWVEALASYTEISPSRKGVKIILRGTLPEDMDRRGFGNGNGVYASGRFFTITGDVYEDYYDIRAVGPLVLREVLGRMLPPQERQTREWQACDDRLTDGEVLGLALGAANGDKVKLLWDGNWEDVGEYESQSNADMALVSALAFYTGPNPEQLDRLFRRSGLMREKWDEQRGATTYGMRTIDRVLDGQEEYYTMKVVEAGGPDNPVLPMPVAIPGAPAPARAEAKKAWKRMLEGYPALGDGERPAMLQAVHAHLRPYGTAFPGDWLDMAAVGALSSVLGGPRFENLTLGVWTLGIAPQGTGKSVVGDELDAIAHRLAYEVGRSLQRYSSGSTAGLIRRLAGSSNARCLAWFSEWTGFARSLEADYTSGMREVLMDLYDGRNVVHQLAQETIVVDRPHLVVAGVTTPRAFVKTADLADAHNGFYSRFLFLAPDTTAGVRFKPREEGARAGLVATLKEHLEETPQYSALLFEGGGDSDALLDYMDTLGMGGTPRTVDLDDVLLLNDEEALPGGRLVARVKKVAGVLELLEERPRVARGVCWVREANVERAVRLVQRGAAYAVRAFGWLSRSQDEEEAGRVRRVLAAGGRLSMAGIMRATYLNRAAANRALELLQEEGLLSSEIAHGRREYFLRSKEAA
jgi:putative DNA primase/helicase